MNLYTFYNYFRNKQYISQIQAENITNAPIVWAKNINPNKIKYIGKKTKN